DTSSWQLVVGANVLWTDILDSSGCANSGSALIPSASDDGGQVAAIGPCVTLQGESTLYASVQHRGYGEFFLRLLFYSAADCSAGSLDTPIAGELQNPDAWDLLTMVTPVPPEAHAVYFLLAAGDSLPHGLSVDDAMLTEQFPIFLDGFDGNGGGETSPCRWGS
ncbi:MAG: hypothetical protein ABIV06_04430, partial [Thermoanaerobaculia bacterium]